MEIKQGGVAHRYIALVMLLITVYILGGLFLALWNQKTEAKQRYDNAQLQLQKYKRMAANLPEVQANNQTIIGIVNNDGRYITAANSSLAAANLQKKLQQVIQQSGANLVSMQAIKAEAESDFLPIGMQLHLRLTHGALVKLLYQLESQKPTGFIYELQIQRSAGMTKGISSKTVSETLLDVRFKYTVFMVNVNDH